MWSCTDYYLLQIVSTTGKSRRREKKEQTNENGSQFGNIFLWNIRKNNILDWASFWGFNMSLRPILFDCKQFHRKRFKPEKKLFS